MSLLYYLFLFYQLLNMFRATMCPSSGADDCVMLQPRVGMCCGCRKVVKTSWQLVCPWMGSQLRSTTCYEPIHGRTACQPVLTTFLQPRNIPTRDYNITQSSAPNDGHMVVRNMLSNQQKKNKEHKSDIQLVFFIHTNLQIF